MAYFWIWLLYLINLLHFKDFFSVCQIWIASDSNNRVKWVEKWYSCYWVQCEALPGKWKEISNILFRKHDHERVVEWFLNSKKKQTKFENHEICPDHMISNMEVVVKNWEDFAQYVMYDVYKPKYLIRRIIALRRIR